MLISSFNEWLKQKELTEATGLQRAQMQHDTQANLDAASFADDQAAGVPHYVINNSMALLNDLIKLPSQRQAQAGMGASMRQATVNPMNYSMFQITGIEGDTVTMKRDMSHVTHSGGFGRQKLTNLASLRDVTDSFHDWGIGQKNAKYYINVHGAGPSVAPRVDAMYQKWLGLSKAQAATGGDAEGGQVLQIKGLLGGDQAVKSAVNQGASEIRDQMWLNLAQKAMQGQDVSKTAKDAGMDDVTGRDAFQNPRFLEKLRLMGAQAIVDQMRLKGLLASHPLDPAETQLVASLTQMNRLVQGAPQTLEGNPQVQEILRQPNAEYFSKLLGFRPLVAWMQQHLGGDELMTRLRQGAVATQAAKPDDNALDVLTGGGRFQNAAAFKPSQDARQVASQNVLDQMFRKKAESVLWKYHNDQKLYEYYEV